jgi:prolipoprotein diacylglyceryl transferase
LPEPVKVKETIHPYQLTGNILLVAAVAGIIGAKIFDVIEHLDQLVKDPVGTLFSLSGLAFYGGLIVAAIAVAVYAEKNNIPWPVIGDIVAPALLVGYGTGRIGCQLSGDGCWGIVNTAPKPDWLGFLPDWIWAFRYPHNVIDEGILISNCTGEHCHILENPVFPTPFYETVIVYTFFLILWSFRKKITVPGLMFSIYLILNGLERFFIEKIRVNIRYELAGLKVTQAEIIATCLIIIGIAGIIYFTRKHRHRYAST